MKREKRLAITERDMGRFAPVPDDYEQFAVDAAERFIFYSRKKGICYCSHCHRDVGWFPVHHNEPTICPVCRRTVIAKSIGYSRKTAAYTWTMMLQPDGQNVLTRYFLTTTDWQDYERPVHATVETYRYVHTPRDTRAYMWWYEWGGTEIMWVNYRHRGMGWYAYTREWFEPVDGVVPYNLSDSVLKGTAFEYSYLEEMLSIDGRIPKINVPGPARIKSYYADIWLNVYADAPYIEKLYKVGFKKLVQYVADCSYSRKQMFANKESVIDVLKIDRPRYKLLLSIGDPSHDDLLSLQNLDRNATLIDVKFETILRRFYGLRDRIAGIRPMRKFAEYFASTNLNADEYRDYIDWLKEQGYPLDDYYLFPKDFHAAHDKLSAEVIESRAKKAAQERALQDKAIRAIYESLADKKAYHLHFGGLFVTPADSASSIIREGMVLHHCVGTYVDKVAKGTTLILFVRKEEEPDTPYYTMEYKDGRVTQLYGSHNTGATENVQLFREKFEKAVGKMGAAVSVMAA